MRAHALTQALDLNKDDKVQGFRDKLLNRKAVALKGLVQLDAAIECISQISNQEEPSVIKLVREIKAIEKASKNAEANFARAAFSGGGSSSSSSSSKGASSEGGAGKRSAASASLSSSPKVASAEGGGGRRSAESPPISPKRDLSREWDSEGSAGKKPLRGSASGGGTETVEEECDATEEATESNLLWYGAGALAVGLAVGALYYLRKK